MPRRRGVTNGPTGENASDDGTVCNARSFSAARRPAPGRQIPRPRFWSDRITVSGETTPRATAPAK